MWLPSFQCLIAHPYIWTRFTLPIAAFFNCPRLARGKWQKESKGIPFCPNSQISSLPTILKNTLKRDLQKNNMHPDPSPDLTGDCLSLQTSTHWLKSPPSLSQKDSPQWCALLFRNCIGKGDSDCCLLFRLSHLGDLLDPARTQNKMWG